MTEVMEERYSHEVLDHDRAISLLKTEVDTLIKEKKKLDEENSRLHSL